ncbi:hypothetical protein M406DRAFT_102467 [Cryphonectria parasitica EP155]|uniref:Uncharacterized protein n=1 Tax=Cryphonectria parasitica (strain ATCC 38755 / EP155) TaxID=660469 RepID=A0A9P5CP46_CRYP1|nr:uncharacterized protein M406DRAFT_102467 [Cryphonectria parasitica EP155]KAF3764796.1 hypothetical protein M406DRAFT_102467 [Cryphonectria parasitica EP155]
MGLSRSGCTRPQERKTMDNGSLSWDYKTEGRNVRERRKRKHRTKEKEKQSGERKGKYNSQQGRMNQSWARKKDHLTSPHLTSHG